MFEPRLIPGSLAATVSVSYLGLSCLLSPVQIVVWMFAFVCCSKPVRVVHWSVISSVTELPWGGREEGLSPLTGAGGHRYHLSLSLSQHDNNLTYNRSLSPLPPGLTRIQSRQSKPGRGWPRQVRGGGGGEGGWFYCFSTVLLGFNCQHRCCAW